MVELVFGCMVLQVFMLGHVVCSTKKTSLPTIAWVAICLCIPLLGYVCWLMSPPVAGDGKVSAKRGR
jgi:hypothetical protein